MSTSAGDELSCISGEPLEKARRELGEDRKTRGAIIQEFRDKLEHWEPSPEDEGLCYLRAKKFDTRPEIIMPE